MSDAYGANWHARLMGNLPEDRRTPEQRRADLDRWDRDEVWEPEETAEEFALRTLVPKMEAENPFLSEADEQAQERHDRENH